MKKAALLFWLIMVLWNFANAGQEIALSSLPVSFLGERPGDLAGHHVTIIGDVNDDGFDDFLATAPKWDMGEAADAGRVYLFYGKTSGWSYNLPLTEADATFHGEMIGNEASHDAFGIGDVNNDGIQDFAISIKKTQASQGGNRLGRVYIFFGSSSKWQGSHSLAEADVIYTGDDPRAEATHVRGVGDLDGDNYDDIIIGAGFNSTVGPNAGKIYIIFGKPTNEWPDHASLTDADASFLAESEGDWAGHRVSEAGDVNGDGLGDFLVSANYAEYDDMNYAGKVYLILGKSREQFGNNVSLSEADASWHGPGPRHDLGWNVASLGDIDDDGLDDVLFSTSRSIFYVLLGKNISMQSNQDVSLAADVKISANNEFDDIGHDISSLGDLNQNGYDDFIIGISKANANSRSEAGVSYVFYGRDTWNNEMHVDDSDIKFTGVNEGDHSGFSCSGNGDINGDGLNDILISAYHNDDSGEDAGKVYMYSAQEMELTVTYPNGDEVFYVGSTETIRWTPDPDVDRVKIEYTTEYNKNFRTIVNSYPDVGAYDWIVPDTPTPKGVVRISDARDGYPSDKSDWVFTIKKATQIMITSPNGGEEWEANSPQVIEWIGTNPNRRVTVEYSLDNGMHWTVLRTDAPNSGRFDWFLPDSISLNCLVRITDNEDPANQDVSDAPFSIVENTSTSEIVEAEDIDHSPGVEIQDRPGASGGQVTALPHGVPTATLSYEFDLLPGLYHFYLRYLDEIDGASRAIVKINGNVIDNWLWDDSHEDDVYKKRDLGEVEFSLGDRITIELTRSAGEYARVDYLEFLPIDVSQGEITVISPNGGEEWPINTQHTISWDALGIDGNVRIELSRNNGGSWTSIGESPAASGNLSWLVNGTPSDECLIRVWTLDNTISDTSDAVFSITPEPRVTITAPNGGESWEIGSEYPITWDSESTGATVAIALSRDSGATWNNLADDTANDGSFTWTATAPASDSCLVRVTDNQYGATDTSDALFSIDYPPSVTVTLPNGGEEWEIGTEQQIHWTVVNVTGNVNIDLSRNNGQNWTRLASRPASDNRWTLTVAGPASDECLVRIQSENDNNVSDVSDSTFSIAEPPSITVTEPNGGEEWEIGTEQQIKWTRVNVTGNVNIDFSRNNGQDWTRLVTVPVADNSWTWTVQGPESGNCLVRVQTTDGNVADTSDAVFTIKKPPSITVIAPNGGEAWYIDTDQMIRWTTVNIESDMNIQLSRNKGAGWTTLGSVSPTDSVFEWTVEGPVSDDCLVRIAIKDGSVADTSDAVFSIEEKPSITVTSPNGGERWQTGETYNITWESVNISNQVNLNISRDNGKTWTQLWDKVENDGSYPWKVNIQPSDSCLVQVADAAGAASDESDEMFAVVPPPSLTVLRPDGGEIWYIGDTQTVEWSVADYEGTVHVELSRDNGQEWSDLATDYSETSLAWNVDGPESESCLVRVSTSDGKVQDTSDSTFSVMEPPYLTVTSPAANDQWEIGSTKTIQWESFRSSGMVSIWLNRQATQDSTAFVMFADSVLDTGNYDWHIDSEASDQCIIKVQDLEKDVAGTSGLFELFYPPELTVLAPNGGEIWNIGSEQNIRWTSSHYDGVLDIELSRDSGESWRTLAENVSANGTFQWTVTEPVSDSCLIRLISETGAVSDTSDSTFSIRPKPDLLVTRPAGGERWTIGSQEQVTWDTKNTSGIVTISLSRDGGSSWESVADSVVDNGSYTWTVTGPASQKCYIVVADIDGTPSDRCDQTFAIVERPAITVTNPNGQETWEVGSDVPIEWSATNIGQTVMIELSRDNGSSWETLTKEAENTESWIWNVTEPISIMCLVRIADSTGTVADTSDAVFTIKYATGVSRVSSEIPDEYALQQNYPNPFNPATNIVYQLPQASRVRLSIYNVRGTLVRSLVDEEQAPGTYRVEWDGRDDLGQQLSSGLYFYRIIADSFEKTQRMMLMK